MDPYWRLPCADLPCFLTWAYNGGSRCIEVDHCTPTRTGSEVIVFRRFPGAIVPKHGSDGTITHWELSDDQQRDVTAWVDQLHRMPLDEVP